MNGNTCICNNKKKIEEQKEQIKEQMEMLRLLRQTCRELNNYKQELEYIIHKKSKKLQKQEVINL
jgi:hypothetical protein